MVINFIRCFLLTVFFLSFNLTAAQYVGSDVCRSCHISEYQKWQGSHHEKAMQQANSKSVLANFDDVTLEFDNKVTRFFKKASDYWVELVGADGTNNQYKIEYTFGYQPLQQYMVKLADGRVQLLPYAWDSRAQEQGGQRWFYLHTEHSKSHNEFYWRNSGQNWNYMCADCHSTNVNKNYDSVNDRYNTNFSEINVACEACHGPASEHINWSKQPNKDAANVGFTRNLSKAVNNWQVVSGNPILQPETITQTSQVKVCAQCHSRRTQISDTELTDVNHFSDRYLLSLIEPRLYYPDGQVFDENYVYGSFLQSKMAAKGVVCSNCHDPHSGQLTLPIEQVCLQCHQAQVFDTVDHHKHQAGSEGALCINCHMPSTTYMQVDERRDHGWHLPRPDFSLAFNTPNVCLSCHQQQDHKWSLDTVNKWRATANWAKRDQAQEKAFAPVFAGALQGYPQMTQHLSHIAQSGDYASIIRASALQRMADVVDTNTIIAVARGLKHQDETIRLGAVYGAANISPAERWRLLQPLLSDETLAVRTEAARALAPLWSQLNQAQRRELQPALEQYLAIQEFNQDRGFALVNQAQIYSYQQQVEKAQKAYLQSIKVEPNFAPAYINLADLYRQMADESAALAILSQGIKAQPDSGALYYAAGLSFIRAKQYQQASSYFKQATEVEPEQANYHYVYGLSIETDKPKLAEQSLNRAYQLSNNPQYLFALCEMKINHNSADAKLCLRQLSTRVPETVVERLRTKLNNN